MNKGFTLIEGVLAIAFVGILAGISIPFYGSYMERNYIDNAEMLYTQTLNRAKSLSQAAKQDDSWGVKIEIEKITLFKGDDFATRNQSYDETLDINANIEISGTDEVSFSKMYGLPDTTGTTTLIFSDSTVTRNISISSQGLISN